MTPELTDILAELDQLKCFRSWISKNRDRYRALVHTTDFLPQKAGLRRRVWHIKNGVDTIPVCIHCGVGIVSWNDSLHVYREYCSNACVHAAGTARLKQRETNLERHGVLNIFENIEYIQEKRLNSLGVKHAMQSLDVQAKVKETNMERYGCEWNVASSSSTTKRRSTCAVKYGTDHAMKSFDVWCGLVNSNLTPNDKIELYKKLNDVNFLTHEHHINKKPIYLIANELGITPSVLRLHYIKHSIQLKRFKVSVMERQISEFLVSHGFQVETNNRKIISPLELDIIIPSHNTAIECNGNIWHSELNGRDRWYHQTKTRRCADLGIHLIHVRQDQWVNTPDIVKSRLLSKLQKPTRVVYGRNTDVREVELKDYNKFVSQHHIQGTCSGVQVAYGLYVGNELVSVISFGRSRYDSQYQFELMRLVSVSGISVVGGASKLFRHFIKTHNPENIVSYCDLSWNTGEVYRQMGFNFVRNSDPSYRYFHASNPLKLWHRSSFQKHKLSNKLSTFDTNASEWDNMVINGYDRVWDCGSGVWEYKRAG